MRIFAAAFLLVVSCTNTRDDFTPDQFSLGYTVGSYEGDGSLGTGDLGWPLASNEDGDLNAITFGLSWDLGDRGQGHEIARALRALEMAQAGTQPAFAPRPPILTSRPPAPPADTVSAGSQALPPVVTDHTHVPCPVCGRSGDDEVGTDATLVSISSEVWTQLILAVVTVLLAIAGWIARSHIPGVKNLTAKGKADNADRAARRTPPRKDTSS